MIYEYKLSTYTVNFKMLGVKTGGFSAKYTSDDVASKNLKHLKSSFGSRSYSLIVPKSGSDASEVDSSIRTINSDSIFTSHTNHALVLTPADCVPLVIFSIKYPFLALVHGSRQGLEGNIIQNTLDKLNLKGIDTSSLRAYIGPSISGPSYLLPKSIIDELRHISWRDNLKTTGDNVAVDIVSFTSDELTRLGFNKSQIEISDIDTATDKRFYSHYRATRYNDVNGRNGVVTSITLN